MKITRGDTEKFKFQRKDQDDTAITRKADEMYFTLKANETMEDFIFQKRLSDGTITFTDDGYYHFTILPEDTNNLDYDLYYFDIEVKTVEDNYVRTLKKGTIQITGEVTFASNEV